MRKDRFAEWLLELVTTRERASSAVGDLRETAASRGEVWFWWNVLGAAASQLWGTVAADPRGVLGLALRAWLVSLALGALIALVGVLVAGSIIGALALRSSDMGFAGGVNGSSLILPVLLFMSVSQFLVGRWIGRRAPGREMPACLAFAILQWILAWSMPLVLTIAAQDLVWIRSAFESSWFLPTDAFCFLGALSVRRRART